MPRCRFCGKKSELFLRYARLPLCKKCFIAYYQRKVREALEKFNIEKDATIAVALSAGKDSVALLHSLSALREVKAIHIALGIEGHSDKLLESCKKLCKDLNIELILFDLKKELGISASDFRKINKKVCSVCGTVKRYLLNKIAWENSTDYVATGHNADDTASAILRNFLTGNIALLARIEFFSPKDEKFRLVGKIKPLYRTLEFENKMYCDILELPYVAEQCPLAKRAMQNEVKALIDSLEKRMPEIKLRIITNYFKMKPLFKEYAKKERRVEFKLCKQCGYATVSDKCKFCKTIEKLQKVRNKTKSF